MLRKNRKQLWTRKNQIYSLILVQWFWTSLTPAFFKQKMSQLSFELIFTGVVPKSGSGRSWVVTTRHLTTEQAKRVALTAATETINTVCGTAGTCKNYRHTVVITNRYPSFRMRRVISAVLVEGIFDEFTFTTKKEKKKNNNKTALLASHFDQRFAVCNGVLTKQLICISLLYSASEI